MPSSLLSDSTSNVISIWTGGRSHFVKFRSTCCRSTFFLTSSLRSTNDQPIVGFVTGSCIISIYSEGESSTPSSNDVYSRRANTATALQHLSPLNVVTTCTYEERKGRSKGTEIGTLDGSSRQNDSEFAKGKRERKRLRGVQERGEKTIDQVEKPVSGGTVKTLFEISRANASINDALEFVPRHRRYEIVLCQRPCGARKILIVSHQSDRTYARLRKEPR